LPQPKLFSAYKKKCLTIP